MAVVEIGKGLAHDEANGCRARPGNGRTSTPVTRRNTYTNVAGGLVLAAAHDLSPIVREAQQDQQLELARAQSEDEMLHRNADHEFVKGAAG